MQHRGLDLDVTPFGEERPDRGDRAETNREHAARFVIGDEIDIPLAKARVGVGEAVPLLGQRPQRLGEQRERLHVHRQLALLRLHDRAGDPDPVAPLDLVAEPGEVVVAELGLVHEQLELAGCRRAASRTRASPGPAGSTPGPRRVTTSSLVVPISTRSSQCSRTSASVWVRSKRTGYGSVTAGAYRSDPRQPSLVLVAGRLHQLFRSKMIRKP